MIPRKDTHFQILKFEYQEHSTLHKAKSFSLMHKILLLTYNKDSLSLHQEHAVLMTTFQARPDQELCASKNVKSVHNKVIIIHVFYL